MLLVREIFHCKPGKVRPMVEKFQAMSKLGEKAGMPPMRVLTDFVGDRYWTVIAEMEVTSLDEFERMMRGVGQGRRAMKQIETIVKDYHELGDSRVGPHARFGCIARRWAGAFCGPWVEEGSAGECRR